MRRRWIGLLAVVITLAGCGSSASTSAPPTTTAVSPTSRPPTPAEAQGQVASADAAACATNYRTLQTAVEAYRLVEGSEPSSQDDLVPEMLREPVPGWQIERGPDGSANVAPVPVPVADGTTCAVPTNG